MKVKEKNIKKLYKRRLRLDVRKYFFSNRIIDHWNSQFEESVNSNTTNIFKNTLY